MLLVAEDQRKPSDVAEHAEDEGEGGESHNRVEKWQPHGELNSD